MNIIVINLGDIADEVAVFGVLLFWSVWLCWYYRRHCFRLPPSTWVMLFMGSFSYLCATFLNIGEHFFVDPEFLLFGKNVFFTVGPLFIALGLSQLTNFLLPLIFRYERETETDHLTGLANRRWFYGQLQRLIASAREGDYFCIMLGDLDGFKAINDRMGHAAGDEVLVKVANILEQAIGKNGSVCRYGGDEFAFILPGFNKGKAVLLKHHLRSALFAAAPTETTLDISLGVAQYPVDGSSSEELVRVADGHLYSHKAMPALSEESP